MRLNSSDQLAALMRVQIASLRQKANAQPAGRKGASAPGAKSAGDVPTDFAALAAERIKAIRPDDPEKSRKAVRIFLESVLLAEFGSELLADPQFANMVSHVHEQLLMDPDLARSTQEAADLLLAPPAT